jgi:hypothetical protein
MGRVVDVAPKSHVTETDRGDVQIMSRVIFEMFLCLIYLNSVDPIATGDDEAQARELLAKERYQTVRRGRSTSRATIRSSDYRSAIIKTNGATKSACVLSRC